MIRIGWRNVVPSLAGTALLSVTLVASAAAAGPRPAGPGAFGVLATLGHPCLALQIDDPGDVTLTQRRDGQVIKTVTYDPDALPDPPCLQPLKPGDRLRISQGASSRVVTVPAIGLTVDRATDHISIQLPTTGELQGWLTILDHTAGVFSGESVSSGFTAEADGIEEGTITGIDIGAGDRIEVTWYDGPDVWTRERQNGSLVVRVGQSGITGTGTPGSTVTTTLRTAGGTLRGKATAKRVGLKPDHYPGGFSAVIRKGGSPVKVKAGNLVRHSQIAGAFSVPAKSLIVDPDGAGSLTVTCPRNGAYVVLVDGLRVDAGPSGNGSIVVNDLDDHGPLVGGTVVQVACDTPKGFGIIQRVMIP